MPSRSNTTDGMPMSSSVTPESTADRTHEDASPVFGRVTTWSDRTAVPAGVPVDGPHLVGGHRRDAHPGSRVERPGVVGRPGS
jgi:hypothetical protein